MSRGSATCALFAVGKRVAAHRQLPLSGPRAASTLRNYSRTGPEGGPPSPLTDLVGYGQQRAMRPRQETSPSNVPRPARLTIGTRSFNRFPPPYRRRPACGPVAWPFPAGRRVGTFTGHACNGNPKVIAIQLTKASEDAGHPALDTPPSDQKLTVSYRSASATSVLSR